MLMHRRDTWKEPAVVDPTPTSHMNTAMSGTCGSTITVFDAAVSTLALDVIPEIEQVVAEMKRVTRPGGVVASAVTQFFGGMPAFDLVIQHRCRA